LGWKKRGESSAAVVSEKRWCLKFLERFENARFDAIEKRGKRGVWSF
jgi:hypothetical protein